MADASTAAVLISEAVSASSRGDFEAAVALLGPVAQGADPDPGALACLGLAYSRLGRFVESLGCWGALLRRPGLSSRVRGRVQTNLARASYYAAASESRAGRHAEAASYMATYCEHNPGDADSRLLAARLSRVVELREAVSCLGAAKVSITAGRWQEAVGLLEAAGSKIGHTEAVR